MWAVPWSFDQQIDFAFLVAATIVVAAVPIVYGVKANFRDPLARAVLSGTGATALAFIITMIYTISIHAGWQPAEQTPHWVARGLYFTVALGKAVLLVALLRLVRGVSRNRGDSE